MCKKNCDHIHNTTDTPLSDHTGIDWPQLPCVQPNILQLMMLHWDCCCPCCQYYEYYCVRTVFILRPFSRNIFYWGKRSVFILPCNLGLRFYFCMAQCAGPWQHSCNRYSLFWTIELIQLLFKWRRYWISHNIQLIHPTLVYFFFFKYKSVGGNECR